MKVVSSAGTVEPSESPGDRALAMDASGCVRKVQKRKDEPVGSRGNHKQKALSHTHAHTHSCRRKIQKNLVTGTSSCLSDWDATQEVQAQGWDTHSKVGSWSS